MELVDRFRVSIRDVWFVQAVLTDCEGQAVVSLGERKAGESIMSVFYDDSAKSDLAPLFAYLVAVGKIVPVQQSE